jgi:hypothetical protein
MSLLKQIHITLFICLIATFNTIAQTEVIDLQGTWQFKTDPMDKGITEQWYLSSLSETIHLPGSMVENGKGDELTLKTVWTGSIYDSSWFYNPKMEKYRQPGNIKFPFWLTPNKYYVGAAWYQKEVNIPANWNGKRTVLFLERPHYHTTVWVGDKKVGEANSLSVAHEYDLTSFLSAGKHIITIRIDNRLSPLDVGKDSHSVTDHTQGNWNGIVGKIELRAGIIANIQDVRVYPDIKNELIKVSIVLEQATKGKLSIEVSPANAIVKQKFKPMSLKIASDKLIDTVVLSYPMGSNVQLWDEFNPALYVLKVKYQVSKKKTREKEILFGMHEFKANGTRFEINGRRTFLRGTVENCVFPLTGYAPMDEASWARVFKICKESGLNHMRFHSFCPPEEAFVAADKAGIYLHVECGSWANHGVTLGGGSPVDQYIYEESERIVKAYANHPSFCMLAYGNEPKGRYLAYLIKFVDYWKARDRRFLITGAATGGSWSVIPNSEFQVRAKPRGLTWNKQIETESDFRDKLENFTVPYVSHEVGQYCVFPNFDEIKKYTGPLKAKNFELFQEDLNDNHMGDQWHDFLMASGKLQALCYKGEIEAALRTPGFGGFQLLGLNDYPGQGTALVGMLDAFWDEKGYITKEEISHFCNVTVPLARIPKFVYLNNENIKASVEVSHFGPKQLEGAVSGWKITDPSGKTVASGSFDPKNIAVDNCISLGKIDQSLKMISVPTKLKLTVFINKNTNSWNFWVYPAEIPTIDTTNIYYCTVLDSKAEEILNKGGKVFLDAAGKVENGKDVVSQFTPVFWNTSWFKMRPPHTTGMLIQSKSEAFRDFPSEYYVEPQWADMMNRQQVMNLENFSTDFRPLVQPIDTWFMNRRLALLFEAKVGNGKLMVCSANLTSNLKNRPAARQFAYSLNKYMVSEAFSPKTQIEIGIIRELFEKKNRKGIDMGTKDAPDELKPQNLLK